MSHEAPIDYTAAVTDLGTGSAVVIDVSTIGSEARTRYHLTMIIRR